jgi:hypothetical protein
MRPVEIARLFLHVRETTQNQGQRVNSIQMFSGGASALGLSWCAFFATLVLDLAYQGKSPIPRQGTAQGIRDLCVANGWMTTTPSAGDLFFYVDANDHAHHVGFYVEQSADDKPVGIAGNTDALGTSSNGDRVAEHVLSTNGSILYAAIPQPE